MPEEGSTRMMQSAMSGKAYLASTAAIIIGLAMIYLLNTNSHVTSLTGFSVQEPTIGEQVLLLENNSNSEARAAWEEDGIILEDEAKQAMEQAERDISEMKRLGYQTRYVEDVLLEAKNDFLGKNISLILDEVRQLNESGQDWLAAGLFQRAVEAQEEGRIKLGENYSGVFEKTGIISNRRQQAYQLAAAITQLQQALDAAAAEGVDIDSSMEQERKAEASLADEQYEAAEEAIKKAHALLEQGSITESREAAVENATTSRLWKTARRHWILTAIALLALAFAFSIGTNEGIISMHRRAVDKMELERDALQQLRKRAQAQRYQGQGKSSDTPKSMYDIKMEEYRIRELRLQQQLPVEKSLLEKCLARRPKWSLRWLNVMAGHAVGQAGRRLEQAGKSRTPGETEKKGETS